MILFNLGQRTSNFSCRISIVIDEFQLPVPLRAPKDRSKFSCKPSWHFTISFTKIASFAAHMTESALNSILTVLTYS